MRTSPKVIFARIAKSSLQPLDIAGDTANQHGFDGEVSQPFASSTAAEDLNSGADQYQTVVSWAIANGFKIALYRGEYSADDPRGAHHCLRASIPAGFKLSRVRIAKRFIK
jgi:hypothetical protein